MKKLIIVLLLALVSTASARMGETKKKCEARYGKSVSTVPVEGMPPSYNYRKNGWQVSICYINDAAVSVCYTKLDRTAIDHITILALVKVNFGKKVFKKAGDVYVGPAIKYVWKHEVDVKALVLLNIIDIDVYKKARAKKVTSGL